MSDQPPIPESSEQRWDRIERTLDRIAERHERITQSQLDSDRRALDSDRRAEQQRQEFEQFKRTMAAVIESLHQSNLRLDANLAQLSAIVVHHHDKLNEHDHRLEDLDR